MILVTGHKGYIGSKLYKKLKESYDVVGIDLKDGKDILECLPDEDFKCVFHMAAFPQIPFSIENPFYTLKQNVLTASKLLEWSKNHSVERFVFSSSAAVYGDGMAPLSPYGLHKLMTEMECKLYYELYGLDTVALRYFNVFSEDQKYGGAYSSVISAWMENLRHNQKLRIDGDGKQTRDYIHVDEIIDVNIFCMNYTKTFGGTFFDVGTGNPISLNQIKEVINRHYEPEWENAPRRKGDIRYSTAVTHDLKRIGWEAKQNPLLAIENCFTQIKE
tara:strand:- start:132 stop:953 length:822 start_codon:yes stop_codon:yes gene_type:complete